jgi:hypothetical protein
MIFNNTKIDIFSNCIGTKIFEFEEDHWTKTQRFNCYMYTSSAQMSTNVSAQMSIHTFSKSAQMSFAHYYINNSQVTADEK